MKFVLSLVMLTCLGSTAVTAAGRDGRARSHSDPSPLSWEREGFDVDGTDFTPRATTSQSPRPMQDKTDAEWFDETTKMLGVCVTALALTLYTLQQQVQ